MTPCRLEDGQSGIECLPDLSSGSKKSGVLLAPQHEPVRSKDGEKYPDEGDQCDGYCGLYLSLPLWITAFWIALSLGGYSNPIRRRREHQDSRVAA